MICDNCDVSAQLPLAQHVAGALGVEPRFLAYAHGLVEAEVVGQEGQQVAPSALVGVGSGHVHGAFDGVAEELHLAGQVVAERPADEVLERLVPPTAVGHEEHTGFQIGYHVGSKREVLVHAALREAGEVGTFLLQRLGQLVSLRTVNQPLCLDEVLDVGTKLLVEGSVVGAIDGHVRADFALGDGAEVDARDGSVCQDF